MDERTHSWIAIRAIALLEDKKETPNLVNLLKPYARKASVGAWIPDQTDAKRGDAGSKTENHVLKIGPQAREEQVGRFVMSKAELLKHTGTQRKIAQYIKQDNYLDDNWWKTPFKGNVKKAGQHLPNRIMALSTMLKDLLLMGDDEIDKLTSQKGQYKQFMEPEVRTQEEAAAMYFFMLSHFVADICMPCHCDARKLSAYNSGIHKELEARWSYKVGTGFEKKNLIKKPITADQIFQDARNIDREFQLQFDQTTIPDLHKDHDEWLEAIYLCRASFSVASIIVPCKDYDYKNSKPKVLFEEIFANGKKPTCDEVDTMLMYDAILNTAIFWKHVWQHISLS